MSTNNVFGAICPGRPIILAQQVDPSKFVITIPNASKVHYVTIFILPNSPFVDNSLSALVYFQLPTNPQVPTQQPEYKLLGSIHPGKPSAIYRVSSLTSVSGQQSMDTDMGDDGGGGSAVIDTSDPVCINIGISIEPAQQAEQTIQQTKINSQGGGTLVSTKRNATAATIKDPNSMAALANKVVGHAYNYLASFIDPQGKVPIKAFDNWWDKFKTKLQNNPNFLNEIQE
ncbi:hypothetical protein KGF56_004906 [Candida oxycetoniae]|uniref:Hikeshi-like domain-containing protein n=1 Tax=Candida oxycetoniae TaxID=497107 RepID=A0AAI9STH5_9ASCO|nr:uncharacterized protein KGF56_004906 [Candida oxycetoniae]KAI3402336.1 hypothetical protein KGF56_004906 [Candida oxycetoniae]